ncbi:MAG: gamma-glutamyl hercynylcysteine S-oxide hydrolase [Nocardioidaceae bacterium]|nr:gamma-glutamyl hercynylcysteine S-oxide hydrolase [Nocardioidaceae bacterium]
MCRHLAYLGPPRTLQSLVMNPPHSLYEQSWAPARQRHGTVNADGFGVGWYVGRETPVRYRRAQPIWSDASFASLAPTIATTCAVAAVRSATAGMSPDETAAAPFTHGRWLFSHNGRLHDWTTARKALLARACDVPDTRAGVDSALLFGLALASWQAGASLDQGLADAARSVLDHGGGRLTMLASDGAAIAAVVVGEPVHLSSSPGGAVIASEPNDDGPWREIAEGTAVLVSAGGVLATAL